MRLARVELRVLQHLDPGLGERRHQLLAEAVAHRPGELVRLPPHLGELLGRGATLGRPVGDAGRHLLPETRHADHEHLVEVGGDDREEAHALEQRVGVVARFLEDAPLKGHERELAVHEEPRVGRGRLRCGRPGRRLVGRARTLLGRVGEEHALEPLRHPQSRGRRCDGVVVRGLDCGGVGHGRESVAPVVAKTPTLRGLSHVCHRPETPPRGAPHGTPLVASLSSQADAVRLPGRRAGGQPNPRVVSASPSMGGAGYLL